MANLITYTFPADFTIRALAGVTVSGGKPSATLINGKRDAVVAFSTVVAGKAVVAIISGKPALEAAVAEYYAAAEAERQAARDALESAVPGVHRLIELYERASNDAEQHYEQFEAMMADENNDGVRPPKAINQDWRAEYDAARAELPRAAFYLKAKLQSENVSWADNTGKGEAGLKAMAILASGGSIEDAIAALAVRRCL